MYHYPTGVPSILYIYIYIIQILSPVRHGRPGIKDDSFLHLFSLHLHGGLPLNQANIYCDETGGEAKETR